MNNKFTMHFMLVPVSVLSSSSLSAVVFLCFPPLPGSLSFTTHHRHFLLLPAICHMTQRQLLQIDHVEKNIPISKLTMCSVP